MGLFHCIAEDGIEDGKNAHFNSGLQGKNSDDNDQ
jgi:hypothetical protein